VSSARSGGLRLGAIADDFTGATDLASALARGGLRVAVSVGLPAAGEAETDGLIVALKIRSADAAQAVAAATAAADYLQRSGAPRLYFKYSSTFDSGETGNIGPVADALAGRTGDPVVVVCPAFPRLDRTVYQGHLFVGARLLDRAGLGDHPLTPHNDSSVLSLLARQTPRAVGLVPLQTVQQGAAAITDALHDLGSQGVRYAVTDAVADGDLVSLAAACLSHGLVTGSAGLASAMAPLIRPAASSSQPAGWNPPHQGPPVILSGSCSETTRQQIEAFARRGPVLRLSPETLSSGTVDEAVSWAMPRLARSAVLIYARTSAGAGPASGPAAASEIESVLGRIARRLSDEGHRRFVVAGGETSGAVVEALGIKTLELGPELSAGVSWMAERTDRGIVLALKSGNFGDAELFVRAASPWPAA
jgi:3-dehydrotetronate 4-kinase